MTEHRVHWVRMGWRDPFMWHRLTIMLGSSMLLVSLCVALHEGFFALLAIVLSAWLWPVRICVGSEAVTLRWRFVRQTVPFTELAGFLVARDERRWSWPRARWLVLERRGKSQIVVYAPAPTLARLEEAIGRGLVASRTAP